MKLTVLQVPLALILVSLFPALALQGAGRSDFRNWKNTDGVSIEARLVEQKEKSVVLEMRNARRYDVPLEKLSPEDKAWLEALSETKASASEEAEGLAFEPILSRPGELLFEDDLSEIREGWGAGNGEWKAEEGVLIGKELAADNHAATFRRTLPLQDAVIQFSFRLEGAKAMTFSIDNATGHLCRVSFRDDGFNAQKDDNDKDKGPDTGARYNVVESDLGDEEWHTAVVELVGDTFLAQVDGEDDEVSLGVHEMFAGEKKKLGFTISGESVHFRDLRIWSAVGQEDWEAKRSRLEKKLN